jgi:hypothetical protein
VPAFFGILTVESTARRLSIGAMTLRLVSSFLSWGAKCPYRDASRVGKPCLTSILSNS